MPRNDDAVANVDMLLEPKAADVVRYIICHSFFRCRFLQKRLMLCLELVLKLNTKRDNWGIYSSSLFSDGLLQ